MDKYIELEPKGAAIISPSKSGANISFEIEKNQNFKNGEFLNAYFFCDQKPMLLGIVMPPRARFSIKNVKNIDAVAITRKNLETGNERVEFWGGDETLKTVFLKKTEENPKENTKENPAENSLIEEREIPQVMKTGEFSFENFFEMDFSWSKIGGYIIPQNYKILNYVLSSINVYRCINYSGHYFFGTAKVDDTLFFAVAVPLKYADAPPFEHLDEKVYRIISDDIAYDALCVGIDETGEFFATI